MATPNWNFPQMAGTDLASTIDNQVADLADKLDNSTQNVNMQRKGTFAARPSASTAKSGCYYWATDIGVQFLSDGTNWQTMNDNTDPIGSGKVYFAASDPADTRFVICDGRAISRTTYATLFALISTTYGTGNGSSTFNIPDLRGRVPVGVDGSANRLTANDALGNSGGAEKHQLTISELAAHSHTFGGKYHAAGFGAFGSVFVNGGGSSNVPTVATIVSDTGTASNGGDGAHNNMQPNLIVNWLIRIA